MTKITSTPAKQRGRPKGRSRDQRSFGPLGDLIRSHRLSKGLGLADVAKACECSVQFISNIEHGRAPLPWDKAEHLARCLDISLDELQAANLSIRSDFKSFVNLARGKRVGKASTALRNIADTANAMAATVRDEQLQEVIEKYRSASEASRKKFLKAALQALRV